MRGLHRVSALLVLLFVTGAGGRALAADATRPHEHTGIVTPYKGAPPEVALSDADIARITTGEVVLKQQQVGSGGRGVAVFDIKATPAKIWSRITDYSGYPRMVGHVSECGNYKTAGTEIYTRFLLDVMGFDVEYFIHHTYRPDEGWLTWTLDYSRQSDLDDSVGYWRVWTVTTSPAVSRLAYSVDIRFKGYIPGFVQDMIAKKGLTDAATWVKRESEK